MSDTGSPYADTREMFKAHTMFRREFALLPSLVRSVARGDVARGDEERAEAVADHIRLLNLVLHHHHAGEDAVLWPLLLARAPREIDPVVELVEGQHERIDDLVAEVDSGLSAQTFAGRGPRGRVGEDSQTLAAMLERLAAALYEHMGLEEKLVLPIAGRHVFAAEWEKMVADGAAALPREAGPVVAGMLIYEGGLDAVPPQMRAVLAEVAPPAYAAHCQRVHGHPAPPRSTDVVIGTPSIRVAASAEAGLVTAS